MTIRKSTYQAAGKIAATIEEHFAAYHVKSRKDGLDNLAPQPEARAIETILDTAFWASLRREEGYSPKISIAFLPPEKSGRTIIFQRRQRFSSEMLTKLSAGIERPGIHLGVWYEEETLFIWGTTGTIPDNCFVVDVSDPGLLVIKHRRRHGFGKFANVAVLTGDQIKIVDKRKATLPDCPELVLSLLGTSSNYDFSLHTLIQLAVSIRAHRKGGILLVISSTSNKWRSSIIHPVRFAIDPPYSELADLMRQDVSKRGKPVWKEAVRKEIDSLAGLTAVDGATIINDEFELLGFGAKIKLTDSNHQIEQVMATEPVLNADNKIINPSEKRGTRHLSAAQFIYDHHDCMALVASQDGLFTVLSWSDSENMVQAYRIDSLLL